MDPVATSDGRMMACVAYASMLVGLPLWLIPFVQKNDAFALRHAKHAAVAYLGAIGLFFLYFFGTIVLSVVTLGFGSFLGLCCMPMLFLPYVPAIHGVILATSDKSDAPLGTFGLGDSLFRTFQVEGPS